MPKLDVGVGDEFPAEEKSHVHHHHYHLDVGQRPFRLLRLILTVALIVLAVRLVNALSWGELTPSPNSPVPYQGLYTLGVMVAVIAVIGTVLGLLPRGNRR